MLNTSEMAIPPALYGLIAYVTCGGFVWVLNRQSTIEPEATADGVEELPAQALQRGGKT